LNREAALSALKDRNRINLDDLCREAVGKCGTDWQKIEIYVTDRLRQMPSDERDVLLADVSRILGYRPPRR
jgi:hypothetical protein